MSCHSRDGYKATTRIAAKLTGADRRDVQKTLHALRSEATGADLPAPTQEQIDGWYRDTLMRLDAANLPQAEKDVLARALMRARFEQPPPDGRDFYVQQMLIARTAQQELVRRTPGLVGLEPPGSQAAQYELGPDGRPATVWYASYGSNLYEERFNVYIAGGSPNGGKTNYLGARDKTPPSGSIPVGLPGTVHYAGESSVWGGAPAFLDTGAPGMSLGRAYRIKAEQFDDVVFQESNSAEPPDGSKVDLRDTIANGKTVGPGLYGTLVHVGDYQGAPVMTFTSPFTVRDALRGDLVYTPDNQLVRASTRVKEQAEQAAVKATEEAAAKAEGRDPKRVPADWPIYSNAPSQAYKDMIGGGLTETHGLTSAQKQVYFAGATGSLSASPVAVPSPTRAA